MIDFKFIGELEGCLSKGYVPDPQGSQSGVTIASGFDIGQRGEDELREAFSPELADLLVPYVGMKKQEAYDFLQDNPLQVSDDQVEEINRYSHAQAERNLRSQWQQSDTAMDFDDLEDQCQTVVASVAFQYGNLSKRTPNFWRQVTACDWPAAIANLRNFGDKYSTRRNKEADLLESR